MGCLLVSMCVAALPDRLTGLLSFLSEGGHLSELTVCFVLRSSVRPPCNTSPQSGSHSELVFGYVFIFVINFHIFVCNFQHFFPIKVRFVFVEKYVSWENEDFLETSNHEISFFRLIMKKKDSNVPISLFRDFQMNN